MIELYNDIFERWIRAIDEIDMIHKYKEKVKSIKYAPGFRYDVIDYTKSDFPAGGTLYDQKDDEKLDYHAYGLDQNQLPAYVRFEHRWNKISWEGFYKYSHNTIEYIEFCLNTGVPSCIQVAKFKDNRRVSFQHFQLNGRGSTYSLVKGEQEAFIQRIQNDPYSITSKIESYLYEDERIIKALCCSVSPGIGQFEYEKIYTYDQDGLTEIRTLYPNGSTQLTYVRLPENLNVQDMINNLAEQMEKSIIDFLLTQDIEQPISLLALNYRRGDRYLPHLKVRSLLEKEEITSHYKEADVFELLFISGFENLLYLEPDQFEYQLQQLTQLMEQNENYNLGTAMLRKAASILTLNRLDKKLAVSDDFVAYAIDWEMEGQEFEKILEECGQKPETIALWKTNKWI